MKAPLLLTAITLGGCAQLVGLDDPVVGGARDAALDASDVPGVDASSDGGPDGALFPDAPGLHDAFEGPDADPVECGTLPARFRDFKAADSPGGHPDFQSYLNQGIATGIVESDLGVGRVPRLSASRPANEVTDENSFFSWYHDAVGINLGFDGELVALPDGTGHIVFDDQLFFPLDGRGFNETFTGEDSAPHNFHFTTEIHAGFIYRGGESIDVEGDDDIWIFIGDRLILDLGGTHAEQRRSVALDSLGLNRNQRYPIDIFHAERYTAGSHLRIATTIDCFLRD